MASSTASPTPAKGSKLWLAEKLSRKQTVLTYALVTVASGRLLWIILPTIRRQQQQQQQRVSAVGGVVRRPPVPVAQLAIWAVFWPAAYVGLRAGERWADKVVRESGMDRPAVSR